MLWLEIRGHRGGRATVPVALATRGLRDASDPDSQGSQAEAVAVDGGSPIDGAQFLVEDPFFLPAFGRSGVFSEETNTGVRQTGHSGDSVSSA